jgi:DNA polymerase-1
MRYITNLDKFTNKDGVHTNAVFTFNNMLDSLIDQFQPDNIMVAFDRSGGTFPDEEIQRLQRQSRPRATRIAGTVTISQNLVR